MTKLRDRRSFRRPWTNVAFTLLALLPVSPLHAAPCDLAGDELHAVAGVIDGDTLLLDDGREVRLTGIQAPKLPLGRSGFEPWPLSEEARKAADALVEGKSVTLRYGGAQIDRHGRVLAQVFTNGEEGALWIQQEMLRKGLARVYTFQDNKACSDELLAAEREARNAGRGIWAHPFYDVRNGADAPSLEQLAGRFEVVEGTVKSAALVRGRIYVNFGDDYRQDFTVTVAPSDAKLFLADERWMPPPASNDDEGLSPLTGQKLRVRGWIDRHNGPEITATHPEQIEFLGSGN
ncbi:MAG: thermonuclease family protein [Parvibaculum sp.]